MQVPGSHRGTGGRVRRGGLAEQVVRAARRKALEGAVEIDEVAQNVARLVYVFARDMRRSNEKAVLPVEIEAPLLVSCEQAAQRLAAQHELPVDSETVSELAGFLVWSWRQRVETFSVGEFDAWRALMRSA